MRLQRTSFWNNTFKTPKKIVLNILFLTLMCDVKLLHSVSKLVLLPNQVKKGNKLCCEHVNSPGNRFREQQKQALAGSGSATILHKILVSKNIPTSRKWRKAAKSLNLQSCLSKWGKNSSLFIIQSWPVKKGLTLVNEPFIPQGLLILFSTSTPAAPLDYQRWATTTSVPVVGYR